MRRHARKMRTKVGSVAARISVLLLVSIVAFGCGGSDGGAEATPTRQPDVAPQFELPAFTAVVVESAFVVDIRQAGALDADVRVGPELIELLSITVSDGVLTIGLTEEPSSGGELREVDLTVPGLTSVEARAGSAVTVSGFQTTGPVRVSAAGGSSVDGSFRVGSIDVDVSGSSSVTLDIAATTAVISAAESSSLALRGSATSMVVQGSGSSTLDLGQFTVGRASVSLGGGSEATVRVTETIESADLAGSSLLRYHGDPELGDVSTGGSSTIEQVAE